MNIEEKIKQKQAEIEHYVGVLERYSSGRWYDMGRRHMDELKEEYKMLQEEYKNMRIYAIVAKDSLQKMNGNRGKLSAQTGHAYLHAYWDSETNYPEQAKAYKNSDHARKITLIVDTVDQLLPLLDKYSKVCGTTKVVDAGFTVFNEPTFTCIGIGPIHQDMIDDDLKNLKVLI